MTKISVVIPAYNEAPLIIETLREIAFALDSACERDYEIIVVDDHSSDDTLEQIKGLSDPRIKCLRLSRNSGSHVALRSGLSQAQGEAVLCLSADGQDDPACIGGMVAQWKEGKQVVWALRHDRQGENRFIRVTAKIFYALLMRLVEVKDIAVDLSRADFFLLDRRVVDAINACPERNTSLFGLIAWLGFSQGSVEYRRRQRKYGRSKWSFRNRVRLAKDWIIAFSGLPLKMVSGFGFIVALSGFMYAAYIVFRALWVSPSLGLRGIPGWESTMAAVLILSGIQMIILGAVGEYLWRNLDESRRRPLYFIEMESRKS